MLEIEQKFAQVDFSLLQQQLHAAGAVPAPPHSEIDHYFNAPDRDFARTGEAFRLRRIADRNFLTYKGPKQPGSVKIRRELELPLPPGDEAAQQHIDLLHLLGYRSVASVSKRRTSYSLTLQGFEVHACLDEVEHLGRFAELEIVAPPEQGTAAADLLNSLAQRLGLHQVERRAYLTMLLQRQAAEAHSAAPRVVTSIADLRRELTEVRRQHRTIGLVPTMGALHEGHASLLRAARSRNDFVVATIFVNPTQFGPNEDFSRYPRTFDDDLRLCASCGVDLIFHPAPDEIYPSGYRTYVEVTGLQDLLEGAFRPGHFRGVATVVLKLFLLVLPDRAYFGQKDAQQVRIIQQMVRDLAVPVEVVVCPTIREPDGLALSSRNRYLDSDQRSGAAVLHAALAAAARCYADGLRDPVALEQVMRDCIARRDDARIDYAAAVDADTFAPPEQADRPLLLALAVRFGATRLIDNLRLEE